MATLRSSMPSMRAPFSTAECVCSEQTTSLRPVVSRAAIIAASVAVEAVSSMWPCQPSGRPSSCAVQSSTTPSSSVDGGRRAPQKAHRVQRRRQQLGEDPRLRRAGREVGEEPRVLPVGDARQQDLVEVAQDRGERLGLVGRLRPAGAHGCRRARPGPAPAGRRRARGSRRPSPAPPGRRGAGRPRRGASPSSGRSSRSVTPTASSDTVANPMPAPTRRSISAWPMATAGVSWPARSGRSSWARHSAASASIFDVSP